MAEPNNERLLGRQSRTDRPKTPVLVATLGVAAAALTSFDVLAAVFGLFGLGFVALAILNLAAFLLNLFLVHLTIALSGGLPPSRRLPAGGGGGGGGFLVWRTYVLAMRAVFLTGALAILLGAVAPHLESIRLSHVT